MGVLRLKRAAISIFFATALALAWTGCGGYDGGSGGGGQTPISNLPNRAFVSNSFTGALQIIDTKTDKNTAFQTSVGSTPTQVLLSKDKSLIAVYASGSQSFTAYDPTKEVVSGSVGLAGATESAILSEDGKFLYAAEKNAVVSGQPNGAVQVVSLKESTSTVSPIPVPSVRWIALNHAGNVMLAFSDQSNTVTKIDPTATTITPVSVAGPFDRPIAAYFSSDDTKAYVLNCGPECGGTTSSVTELTISNGTTRNVPVSAATIALLDGTNLYVAGAPNAVGGTFQVVDTTAMTASTPKTISDGTHSVIMSAGGKIWVGAKGCAANKGCLSVFNTSDQTVKIDDPTGTATSKGDVTGMTPISGRNVVYVVEGGELRVYDIATVTEITPVALDVVGKAYGVVALP
jgi:DNA-binding beta-propeller fold protein YncE